jgi:septal ring factor EnvC (AmiA/AmiB activator)
MTHRLLTLGLLSTLVLAGAARAGDTPPPADKEKDRLEQLRKDIKQLRDDLNGLQVARDEQLKNLEAEMKLLTQKLNSLDKKLDGLNRSFYGPSNPASVQTATIRLQNRSGVPATVLLSGQSYRVPPMETVVLQRQPAGGFNYEVLAEGFGTIQGNLSRTLVAGETFTITINP